MKKLLIIVFLFLFLVSCAGEGFSPSGSGAAFHALSGGWVSDDGRCFLLASDGNLELPGQGARAGKTWSRESDTLILSSVDITGANPVDERFRIVRSSGNRIHMVSGAGQNVNWHRDEKEIAAFSGRAVYHERMVLPEQSVHIRISLFHPGNNIPFSSSLAVARGEGSIPFAVHYRKKDVDKNRLVDVRVTILVAGVPLMATPEAVTVSLDGTPSITVQAATETPQGPIRLEETYWRLTSLDGKPSRAWPGQSEPHFLLRSDGQVVGSDGCNNFFGQWQQSGSGIKVTPGGSTLKMCPEGMDQAEVMMQALKQADSWSIRDGSLTLAGGGKALATFDAVAL